MRLSDYKDWMKASLIGVENPQGTEWWSWMLMVTMQEFWAMGSHLGVFKQGVGSSLVAEEIKIGLPMQGTWVWPLVQEDSTCLWETKHVCHSHEACALEPACHNTEACPHRACALRSPYTARKSSQHSSQLEKVHAKQWRPVHAKSL